MIHITISNYPKRNRSPVPSKEDSVPSPRSQSESSEVSASSVPSQRGLVLLSAQTTTDSSPVLSVVQTVEKQLARAALARQNEILAQMGAEITVPKTQLSAAYRPPTSEKIWA